MLQLYINCPKYVNSRKFIAYPETNLVIRRWYIKSCTWDSRTVVPDYAGNQFLSSLGNIESTKLAGLIIVSFILGDVLVYRVPVFCSVFYTPSCVTNRMCFIL
jgi:hypothetical protein